jgi:2-amino-4-hydroxy-6-hydroxymethyldihydropteridine diphosphokinase
MAAERLHCRRARGAVLHEGGTSGRLRGACRGSGAHECQGDQDPDAQAAQNSTMRAYIGLGANLGDRDATIRRAVEALAHRDGIEVVAVSSLRETEPVDFVEQPRFLNGVVALETDLEPSDLLAALLAVEQKLGRTREGPRFGPRTIDLDLLVYGDAEVDEPGLTVPHPRLAERRFALEPLAELDPDLVVPGRGRVEDLLRGLQSR